MQLGHVNVGDGRYRANPAWLFSVLATRRGLKPRRGPVHSAARSYSKHRIREDRTGPLQADRFRSPRALSSAADHVCHRPRLAVNSPGLASAVCGRGPASFALQDRAAELAFDVARSHPGACPSSRRLTWPEPRQPELQSPGQVRP